MVVPVQQQIRAVRGNHAFEDVRIQQSLVLRRLGYRRMMDQYDAKQIFAPELVERRRKFGKLLGPQPAGREKGRGRHTG